MLAAGSFSSPYEHLSQPETKRMVEHYTAYLSDNTRLIANPGLKVSATAGPLSWRAPSEGRVAKGRLLSPGPSHGLGSLGGGESHEGSLRPQITPWRKEKVEDRHRVEGGVVERLVELSQA